MFRTLGLRHLCVVNKHNSILGIVTRADLCIITEDYFNVSRTSRNPSRNKSTGIGGVDGSGGRRIGVAAATSVTDWKSSQQRPALLGGAALVPDKARYKYNPLSVGDSEL
jgi:hypothetical protein